MDDDQFTHHLAAPAQLRQPSSSTVRSVLFPYNQVKLISIHHFQSQSQALNTIPRLSTMRLYFRRKWEKIKHRDNRPQNTDSKHSFNSDQYKSSSAHAESSAPASYSDKPHEPIEQKRDTGPKDLWQIAYEKLSNEDQQLLSADRPSLQSSQMVDHRKDARTLRKLEEVIQLTEQQYKDYRNGGLKITQGSGKEDINIRDIAHRILDATLSFKDIISAIAVFDPTSHASSAWAIVSLGLTVCVLCYDTRRAKAD